MFYLFILAMSDKIVTSCFPFFNTKKPPFKHTFYYRLEIVYLKGILFLEHEEKSIHFLLLSEQEDQCK